jgi:hypothetical protein
MDELCQKSRGVLLTFFIQEKREEAWLLPFPYYGIGTIPTGLIALLLELFQPPL